MKEQVNVAQEKPYQIFEITKEEYEFLYGETFYKEKYPPSVMKVFTEDRIGMQLSFGKEWQDFSDLKSKIFGDELLYDGWVADEGDIKLLPTVMVLRIPGDEVERYELIISMDSNHYGWVQQLRAKLYNEQQYFHCEGSLFDYDKQFLVGVNLTSGGYIFIHTGDTYEIRGKDGEHIITL